MRRTAIACALAAGALTGCITVAGDHLDDVTPAPGAVAPSIEQTVGDFSFHLDGGKMVTSNKMGRALNDEILKRWIAAGWISGQTYVASGAFSGAAGYELTLSGNQEGESSVALQVLSGLTLTVIPYSVDSRMELRYSLRNAGTGCVFAASVMDSYDTIVGILLLPVSPFAQGGRERTFDRIAHHVYAQLASQGAFEPDAKCPDEVSSHRTRAVPIPSFADAGPHEIRATLR